MMKKEYRKPETEVTRFEAVDVITTSGMSQIGTEIYPAHPDKPIESFPTKNS